MNTPDNCYLDKGHDAHDLLGPGESCKACGFIQHYQVTPPEPMQQDREESVRLYHAFIGRGFDTGTRIRAEMAKALARARHAGEVAERERSQPLVESARLASRTLERMGHELELLGYLVYSAECFDRSTELDGLTIHFPHAAIRSLAPAAEGKP